MNIQRIAAFSDGETGGNPAGILIAEVLPEATEMQQIAAEVGFSETAFATPIHGGWRVRYFSPESEVPFCGHATIALGAALALEYGDGVFPLTLNHADISVEGHADGKSLSATLQSPPTRSAVATDLMLREAMDLFGYTAEDLDPSIPPAQIHGGSSHMVLALKSREKLKSMVYDLEAGRAFMERYGLTTVALVYAETAQLFHTRNPFASGGVFEDPATGAAAAAFAGYLRDLQWPHGGSIDLIQGEDMGMRSLLHAEITPVIGASIRISGKARVMDA
jgi:PhzF family phenazine biosynthesis protein